MPMPSEWISQQRCAGFTLLELLIAIAIFSLLASGCYSLFKSVSRTHEITSALWQDSGEVQRALLLMNKDFIQIVPRPIRDELGEKEVAFGGSDEEGEVVMTRGGWRNITGEPRSELQRLGYYLDGDQLIRRFWETLDRAPETPYLDQVVLEHVQGFTVKFRDNQKRWSGEWPPENSKESEALVLLPTAIEYTIVHERLGKIQQLVPGPTYKGLGKTGSSSSFDPNNPTGQQGSSGTYRSGGALYPGEGGRL